MSKISPSPVCKEGSIIKILLYCRSLDATIGALVGVVWWVGGVIYWSEAWLDLKRVYCVTRLEHERNSKTASPKLSVKNFLHCFVWARRTLNKALQIHFNSTYSFLIIAILITNDLEYDTPHVLLPSCVRLKSSQGITNFA